MNPTDNRWLYYALAGAACAAMINVLGKLGLKDVNSDLATGVRSVVQAVFVVGFCGVIGAWGKLGSLHGNTKAITSIIAAGICGGLSWIFVFRALQLAPNVKVAPIDKLSLPLGIVLSVLLLAERPTLLNWFGIALIVAGAYLATYAPAH